MNPPSVPRREAGRRELAVVVLLAATWLGTWCGIAVATVIAGGVPVVSPVSLIDPDRLLRQYEVDGGRWVWPHLLGAGGRLQVAAFWGALVGLVMVAAVLVAVVVVARRSRRGVRLPLTAPPPPERIARWATVADLYRLRSRRRSAGRLVLGERGGTLIATERETSVLVIGPTRSGKTSALVVPNLFDWRGPAVVTSTKSELVDITAAHRQRLGPVYVYDPTGEIGDLYPSVTWSPIEGCQELDRAWMVAAWLCAGLQQGGSKGDNDWSHWAESGKLLIAPLLYCAAVSPSLSIVDVRDWIHGFDLETPLALLQERAAEEEGEEGGDTDPHRAIGMLSAVDQRPEKERGTVFSTVARIFSVFNERAVARSARASRFSAEELCDRRGTLYLCTPRQSPERVASLFVGILMTVVTHAYLAANRSPTGRLDPELGLFLDELANVVPIEELPAVASQGAGRGVILMSIIQDMSQLRHRYGPDRANSVLNNHGAKVFLPGISDPETCDLVARMVGHGDHTDVSMSVQGGRASRSFSVRREQLVSPEALRQLREGTAVLLYRSRPPAVVRLRPWFVDRRLRALAGQHLFRCAEQVTTRSRWGRRSARSGDLPG